MLVQEDVINALQQVQDPELHQSIVTLNMVRNIHISGTHLSLDIMLTIPGCPLKAKIQQDVEEALQAIGASSVAVTFGVMTEQERRALSSLLQAKNSNEQGMPNMLQLHSGVQFIAITSGKGGVGKSTVTINLAVALARLGKRVGILDADIYGFSIPAMMNIEQKPIMLDQTVIPVESHGVKLMSMGFFTNGNQPVMWRGPMLNKWIRNFLVNTVWGELDFLLIDLPPGTGDVAIDMAAMIPQAQEIIVTTPHLAASHVASRAGLMAQHTKHSILGVVENMAYFEGADGQKNYLFGQGGAEHLAKLLQTEVIARIPFAQPEENTGSSIYDEETVIGEIFTHLAEDLLYQ
ncbi:Mrp/NBP35 family ATP-binding protein [Lysinibacillus sphaericus]|uniref:Iron-sulfur cluster carrier protein n=2 Tax=Lysinibacillus TaxID=400634 RepID=A0A2S0K2Y7_LYSSH|nr:MULTISPECIES: Mrp/NBP35 family ATP-binding protein [Lysinibacillus]AVK97669.1 MRP family ATP-binding protein [Lysinibacillus sphaericus]MCS1381853.1 Mrp/NBP35 family ATP-binding protein [Lysinibacillus sphaericus]MED4545847.1 Mrp/NBP35 family ATP-binding protein [Lysinibacillus sphaericus]TKI17978.1 Mrp/NBP35 family ATP-binding protein [Lysinibacillus sphaericus]TKI48040.1 Mrp/NBP35 family ATP-binding protein [Lysinibacillus tabacifolii]